MGWEFACSWRYEKSNSCSQLSTQGSREGARQRRERRGASAVGLGSWSAFSRPSALIWYHERRSVAHVSQDPSPRPHSISFLHSRPSPCCEFLKKVTSRPSEIEKQPRVSTLRDISLTCRWLLHRFTKCAYSDSGFHNHLRMIEGKRRVAFTDREATSCAKRSQ